MYTTKIVCSLNFQKKKGLIMSKKILLGGMLLLLFLTGCLELKSLILVNQEIVPQMPQETPVPHTSLQPLKPIERDLSEKDFQDISAISSPQPSPKSLPTIKPDLNENEFWHIEAIILADIKRESISKNTPIEVLEIIPSSSGNTRVLIQFMTHVKKPTQEYSCYYTVWFYQNNGVWHHETYRTDDFACELSTPSLSF